MYCSYFITIDNIKNYCLDKINNKFNIENIFVSSIKDSVDILFNIISKFFKILKPY